MILQQRSALIVEDNHDFSDIFQRLLAPWKLEIETATSLSSALEITSRRSFDLYTIDLNLADGDCEELLSRLAARGEPTASRCILVTSFPLIATAYTAFPIVSKAQISSLGPHLLRILGEPLEVAIQSSGATP